MKVKDIIKNTFGIILALIIIFFVVVFIWLGCVDTKDQVKEALSITINFFGGLATLGAAIIAAMLYSDWKAQEKSIFIRNVAYETSSLIVSLFNIMQGYTNSKDRLLDQIMPIQSQITLKLSILNRQINNSQMKMVNKHFPMFMRDYVEALNLHQHDTLALKNEVSKLIESYSAELGYITKLADIENVFEMLKEAL